MYEVLGLSTGGTVKPMGASIASRGDDGGFRVARRRLRGRRRRPAPAPRRRRSHDAPPVVRGARRTLLPEAFESEDFIVTFARAGDTPESLAARYLGDAGQGVDDRGLRGARARSRRARRW